MRLTATLARTQIPLKLNVIFSGCSYIVYFKGRTKVMNREGIGIFFDLLRRFRFVVRQEVTGEEETDTDALLAKIDKERADAIARYF